MPLWKGYTLSGEEPELLFLAVLESGSNGIVFRTADSQIKVW